MNGWGSETERTVYTYSDVSVQLCEVSLVSDLLYVVQLRKYKKERQLERVGRYKG